MLNKFKPNLSVKSVAEINIDKLLQRGIKAVVMDVDNTVARDNAPKLEPFAADFVEELKNKGLVAIFISNNTYERIDNIVKTTGCHGIGKAGKPSLSAYNKVFELTSLEPCRIAAVGDQMFTDIFGANRAGLYSILVDPVDKHEIFAIKIKRPFEKIVKLLHKIS